MISKNNFTYSGGTLWKSYELYLNIHHDLVTLFTRYRNFRFFFFLNIRKHVPVVVIWFADDILRDKNGMVRISVPAALCLDKCHASEKHICSTKSEQQFWKVKQFRKDISWLFQDKSSSKIEWKCNQNSGCQSSLVKCCKTVLFS